MKKACLSMEQLYDKFGEYLTYGKISVDQSDDNDYYDLIVPDGIACMDGEECDIFYNDGHVVTLINRNGERDITFRLTREEFQIANIA